MRGGSSIYSNISKLILHFVSRYVVQNEQEAPQDVEVEFDEEAIHGAFTSGSMRSSGIRFRSMCRWISC